jgi:hydrogenase expression/formation protein HypC
VCLGIPGQVQELVEGFGNQLALVNVEGAARRINIGLLDEGTLQPGDWILIHMGMAMEKVTAAQAADARSGLTMLGSGGDEP